MALKLLFNIYWIRVKYEVDDTHVCNTHVLYVCVCGGGRGWV